MAIPRVFYTLGHTRIPGSQVREQMDVITGNVAIESAASGERPPKRKHDAIGVDGVGASPELQRKKMNRGWVCNVSNEDGTTRHMQSASGRVMLEALVVNDKNGGDDTARTKKVSADMACKLTPKIIVASVRGNVAMAKDALASTLHPPSEAPKKRGQTSEPAGAVDTVATANMLEGLVSE